MRCAVRIGLGLSLALLGSPVRTRAQVSAVATAIHSQRWADADALAAEFADPVARKLVTYYRLLTPGAAQAVEIASFMSESPDWPHQGALSRRLQEALAIDQDDRLVLDVCARRPPDAAPTLLHCADAAGRAGRTPDAMDVARRAWLSGITDPAAEAQFLRQWAHVLTPSDQWRRFDRLAWIEPSAGNGPASRQVARLDPARRQIAVTRLALRRDDAAAAALFAVRSADQRRDPGLMLERAKWLRRGGRESEAVELWTSVGAEAERAAAPEHRLQFWVERDVLARRLLRDGNPAGAYAVANETGQSATEPAADAAFLAGWIALRRLRQPGLAARHFQALASLSKAAITQGRAHYWLGRAAAAMGDAAQAEAEFTAAAAWPTTYYGQLAVHDLHADDRGLAARIEAVRDPAWTPVRALLSLGSEMARAATLLASWGETRRAGSFLLRLDELSADEADHTLAARLALGLGAPEFAVAIARRAGRDGLMLPESGWPRPVDPPAGLVEKAVAMGVIRQESSFDFEAGSPVGARGLMQLMPATAADVAQRLGEPISASALISDPTYNMRLGTAYLKEMLDRFGGVLPLAVAGYNAGPTRVQDWLTSIGDPAHGQIDMIDWIELIPFAETRNYVQRVIENTVVYRVRRGVPDASHIGPYAP